MKWVAITMNKQNSKRKRGIGMSVDVKVVHVRKDTLNRAYMQLLRS